MFRLAASLMLASLPVLAVSCARTSPSRAPLELWLYCTADLAAPTEVDRLATLWGRAAAAGYRHVVLADERLARPREWSAEYLASTGRLRERARVLGLEIVPAVFPIGRSQSLLAANPDLAEGVPVRGARMVVRGGVAEVVADPPVRLGPPDLRDPGVSLDRGIARISGAGGARRMWFRVPVHPERAYHVSVRARTRGFEGSARILVRSGARRLHWGRFPEVAPNQEWRSYDLLFHSRTARTATLVFEVRGRGSFEWGDWRIEESGPVHLLRRESTPFVMEGAVAGRDYDPPVDSVGIASARRGRFDEWHEPPRVRTTLPEGTALRASWHDAAVVARGQVTCCISEPATMALLREQARAVQELWRPAGCLMQHDEVRALNLDPACRARGRAPGELLAEHARECVGLLDGLTVYAWSDMFDPHHNAVPGTFLVSGSLAGSWMGLDPRVVIVNWNEKRARESLRFFARRGHRQILAGYYDGPVKKIRQRLVAARGVEGVTGVMYTTWRRNFDDLEEFARICRQE